VVVEEGPITLGKRQKRENIPMETKAGSSTLGK